jgi:hypothetical protein
LIKYLFYHDANLYVTHRFKGLARIVEKFQLLMTDEQGDTLGIIAAMPSFVTY